MRRLLYLWMVLLLGLSSLSCGYTTSSAMAGNFRSIHISSFKNSISYSTEDNRNLYLPLLETKVTNAIIDRFLFDGHLRIADKDRADIVLTGELKNYQRDVLRYTDANDVQEYRISITVSMTLWDTVQKTVVWEEPSFIGETTYFTVGALAKSESVAVEDAITDLARRIVERTIENW